MAQAARNISYIKESQMEVVDQELHREYQKELERHIRWLFGEYLGVPGGTVDVFVQQRRDLARGKAAVQELERYLDLKGKRVLDVGSGWGELVFCCREKGAEAYGIEPDEEELKISQMLLECHGLESTVAQGVGEKIPFPDNHFDIVTCHNVLEHVQDLPTVIREIVRVTKPGGHMLISVPNYLFPYEGHYRVKWFPLTPKWIGRHILKAMGRNPEFLMKHINYTTYPGMTRRWKSHKLQIRNLSDELLRSGKHPNTLYRSGLARFLALNLKLYPNITWLLTKPAA